MIEDTEYIGYTACMSGVGEKIVSETVPELLALQLAALLVHGSPCPVGCQGLELHTARLALNLQSPLTVYSYPPQGQENLCLLARAYRPSHTTKNPANMWTQVFMLSPLPVPWSTERKEHALQGHAPVHWRAAPHAQSALRACAACIHGSNTISTHTWGGVWIQGYCWTVATS